jgi:hypothetical protein
MHGIQRTGKLLMNVILMIIRWAGQPSTIGIESIKLRERRIFFPA